MPRHFADLTGATTLATGTFQLAGRVVDDLVANHATGVIHRPAGTGKTYAVEAALESRNRFDITNKLLDLLAHPKRLVVVDEAQRLNGDCIEMLRHLHDEPRTTFALLYVGDNARMSRRLAAVEGPGRLVVRPSPGARASDVVSTSSPPQAAAPTPCSPTASPSPTPGATPPPGCAPNRSATSLSTAPTAWPRASCRSCANSSRKPTPPCG